MGYRLTYREIEEEMLARPARWAFVHPITHALRRLGIDTPGVWYCVPDAERHHITIHKDETP